MNTKDLLIKQANEAFELNEEMSLLYSLKDLTQEEAMFRLTPNTWTIEEILYHSASAKIEYCKQGFGVGDLNYDKPLGEIDKMMELLHFSQRVFMDVLSDIMDEELDKSIPTQFHGVSALHFFWIMIMHDLSHGAQIRTIRRAFGTRTDYYPIS